MASVEKSIITLFLERLNVKHTQYYTDKLFNEHPYRYNLFGLSDILTTYGIENWALRIEKKEDIFMAKTPFLAHAGGHFVVVDGITEDRIRYVWNGKSISVPVEEFFKIWTGVLLLAEPDEQSAEPDYLQHRQRQKISKLKHFATAISLSVVFLVICAVAKVYASLGLLLLFLLNMAGIYVGYLLLLKHLHIGNAYGDKICSLFEQTDCNNILESNASSFLGLISWSEIGLGYFISNVIIILFFPHLSTWMVLINICALPYSFWSIWYQGIKVKRWCPLCLMVQALMWIIFFLNLGFGFISLPFFDILQIGTVVCIYLIPILLIHSAAPFVEDKHRLETLTQEMNSLKANENVFKTLLSDQPHKVINGHFFLTIVFMLVSCSNGDSYETQCSNIENSQVITNLKNVNSELLSTVPSGTRWNTKDRLTVVSADIGGAWGGGRIGGRAGGTIGMAFGNPITGAVFGAFLGGVIGGAYSSWLAAPEAMVNTPEEMLNIANDAQSIEKVCMSIINEDMSINISIIDMSALRVAESTAINKLDVEEELIIESKLDDNSLNIGKVHNLILSVMDGSVTLQNEEQAISDSSSLKEAFFNSESFIDSCKAVAVDASIGHLPTSDTMLSKVMELFNQVLEGYAFKIDDVAFIIGKYVDVIEESDELTTEQKQCIKSGLATALYSFKYWESTLVE